MKLSEALHNRTTYELSFALYLSTVVMSVEELRDFSWSTTLRLLIFSHFHPGAHTPIDSPYQERLIAFILAWLLVIIFFLALRLLDHVSLVRAPLEMAAGCVALGGLPSALLYRGFGNHILLIAQIVLSGFLAFLYVYRRWPASARLNLALLTLYFGFSAWAAWHFSNAFPLQFFLLWPGVDWILGTYQETQNLYPLLGFVFSVLWGIHVRDTANARKPPNVS